MNAQTIRFTWFLALLMGFAGVTNSYAAAKPAKAKITVQPVKQTVELGASASLAVTATSVSPVTYQWYFNKAAITGATASSYNINPITPANDGKYYVVVTNEGGSVSSTTVKITVNLAPASLPVGTALYDELTVTAFGETYTGNSSWMISSGTSIVDPEAVSDVYTFTYKRTSTTKATLTVTGSSFYPDYGDFFGESYVYKLTYTGLTGTGERTFTSAGTAVITAPKGYKPSKVTAKFSGTTSIDIP